MTDTPALIPIEQRTVDFYGDAIEAALVGVEDRPVIYVPIKPLCDYLGLDWSAQRQRILRDEVLAEGMVIITMPSTSGDQPTACLPLDLLPGWLFGISTSRVKAELRDKITRYRRDCFRVLWEAFQHEILPAVDLELPRGPESGAELAYRIAVAVQHLAQQQIEYEQRITGRVDAMARWAKGIEGRVASLELSVGPDAPISEAEAAEVALIVKTVAHALEQKGEKNGYGRVYGELYRVYGVGSYRKLPRGKLAEVLAWLRAWYEEVSG